MVLHSILTQNNNNLEPTQMITTHSKGYHSLSSRIVILFCVFTLVISTVFGGMSLFFMYVIEDSYIEKDVLTEARYMSNEYQKSGDWPKVRKGYMTLHPSTESLPQDIRDKVNVDARHGEYFGEQGRHYHVYQLEQYPGVFLVAEVSDQLLVRQIRSTVIKFLAVSVFIVTLISCLLAWVVGRKTVKPLQSLVRLVDGVAPEKIPQTFAKQYPNNEVGVLAQTLENTLQSISQAMNREKNFTRDVSHELRTPLAVIKNAIELTHEQATLSSENKLIMDRIYHSAQQMESTIETLLLLARKQPERQQQGLVALMPIVEKSILDNHLLLVKKQVDVELQDSCQTNINANASMLKLILDNLLSNAFKYTDSGCVRVGYQDGRIMVHDTGPGIEADISKHVTEMGVKGSKSDGLGFGLSIVKRLCEHQGWQMEVENDNGTRVSIVVS